MNGKININNFINDLLHITDVKNNKLIDIYAGKLENTLIIKNDAFSNLSAYMLSVIQSRIGKPASVVLKGSSINATTEQIFGVGINAFDWENGYGVKDAKNLQEIFISGVYKDLSQKGTNPLYLTVGAFKWQLDAGKNEVKDVYSPILIFPIRLIRPDSGIAPVNIEFINDDIFINPCLIAKIKEVYGEETVKFFPHVSEQESDLSEPVDLDVLGNGSEFFERLNRFILNCNGGANGNASFTLNKDLISIISYNHDEICMYYDIQKNKDKIYSNSMVDRIFNQRDPVIEGEVPNVSPQFIMPKDSLQEEMIRRVVGGQSIIINGPPGTGKTLTITNMIASLLNENKRVLLCSKKLAALSEIHAKLPQSLRKFTMLLDCETEAQAAKLNPATVRGEFKKLLESKKYYAPRGGLSNDLSVVRQEMADSAKVLREYKDLVFNQRDIIGKNYYEALDLLCDKNIEPIRFISPKLAYSIPQQVLNEVAIHVDTAANAFYKITTHGQFDVCPWLPVSRSLEGVDTNTAFEYFQQIKQTITELKDKLQPLFSAKGLSLSNVEVGDILEIVGGNLTEEEYKKLIQANILNSRNVIDVQDALTEYLSYEYADSPVTVTDFALIDKNIDAFKSFFDQSITVGQFKVIAENLQLLSGITSISEAALTVEMSSYNSLLESKAQLEDKFYSIFRKDLGQVELQLVSEAGEALSKYVNVETDKPKALDFKAKRAVKNVETFGYGDQIAFNQIVSGVSLYQAILGIDEQVKQCLVKMSSILKCKLNDQQKDAIIITYARARISGFSLQEYVAQFSKLVNEGATIIAGVSCDEGVKVSDVIAKCNQVDVVNDLVKVVKRVYDYADADNVERLARGLSTAKTIYDMGVFGADVEGVCDTISAVLRIERLADVISRLSALLRKFKKECFDNYYTNVYYSPTFGDYDVFMEDACDRNILGAVSTYLSELSKPLALPISQMFKPFENGLRGREYTIYDTFIYSVYALAVEFKQSQLNGLQNGLGERITSAYDKYAVAEKKEQELITEKIEAICMGGINENDPAFAFAAQSKAGAGTLRLMFKKHAEGINKLVKCFLLSPSTASVLLTQPSFFDFDVVICDEASQLEPTSLLPLLIRAKQLVLVGDVWQMPPIKRLVARTEKVVDEGDGDYTVLSSNTSALSLALMNQALKSYELGCHYRSKTESLIAFSQKMFYPFMRTFPAVYPKGEGIGLDDIYVADGRCEGGENYEEAKKVIELLEAHYERYFDGERLSESVGVVCFGTKQVDCVNKMLNGTELQDKILKSTSKVADEVKEKVFFVKPIDKVQGQEIDHLILSLTYGKNKAGKLVNAFGELNRGNDSDKLGQCIFNVAVTRAKRSVMVVRSIHHHEIQSESVQYIADYLRTVSMFKEGGKSQFIGTMPSESSGFIKSVCQTIIDAGVAEERIVLGYGQTLGSISIPLVVLDKNLERVEFALWCEVPTNNKYDYFDYNLRYFEILKERGWNFSRVYIHDWIINNEIEKRKIVQAVQSLV